MTLPCDGSTITIESHGEKLWGCVEAYESSVYIEPLSHRLQGAGLDVEGSWGVWLNGTRYAELAAVNTSEGPVIVGSTVYALRALEPGGGESLAYIRVTLAAPTAQAVTGTLEALKPPGALEPPPAWLAGRLLLAAWAAGLVGLAFIAAYVFPRLARGRSGPEGG